MTNYKCIVTLKNGAHKIIRMTKDVMARLVMAFRKNQNDPWLTRRYEETYKNLGLTPGQVIRLLSMSLRARNLKSPESLCPPCMAGAIV